MAENQSFLRAFTAVRRALLAPMTLLMVTATLVVVAPTSNTQDASASSFLSRTFGNAGTTEAAGTTNNSTGTLGSAPTLSAGRYNWTVPATGRYRLLVEGGAGGNSTYSPGYSGGNGASVTAELNLTVGTSLVVSVGHQGLSAYYGGGGGGASGVVASGGSPATYLAVAGGGGGASIWRTGNGGVTTTSGQDTSTSAGTNGGGGAAGWFSGDCGIGGGGGGYQGNGSSTNGNGSSPSANNTSGGQSYLNGGTGSVSGTCGDGGKGGFGFAGGGKAGHGGGGGGGYSGGAGGQYRYSDFRAGGGGGGSYVDAVALTSSLTGNSRSGHGQVVITLLAPAPTTFAATVSSPTNVSGLTYSIVFSEDVTGLTTSDFAITGTSTGWAVTGLTGSGSTYSLTVASSSATTGTVIVSMLQNAVLGSSTMQNGPGGDTAAPTMNIDVDPPTASVTSAPSSPASAMSLTFGVAFSESVSGIAAGDFSNAGTAQGCVFTPSTTSGSSVNVVVTQCQEGSLQLQLAANGVSDAAGNTGPASALTTSSITLAASALSVTGASQTVNFGGSWTDSYSQSGLQGSDTLTVTYSYSGTTNDGAPYGPSSTKPTQAGSYQIIPTVSYGGANANRYALTRTNGTLTINRVAQSTLTVSSTTMTYGQTLSLATTGGSGTGAVSWQVVSGTCSVAGSSLTPGDAGSSCVVKATKAQDNNYTAASSANTTITTSRASQSALTVSTTSTSYGNDLVLGVNGGSGTGAVTWQVISGTCTVVGALLSPGDAGSSCVVKATKAQDTNYLVASTSNTTITINKASQTGFTITSASTFTTGSTHSLTSSGGQSGGSVSWQVTSGICSLTGTTLTASRGGVSCTVEATRAGSTNYLATTDTMVITVDKIVQVLTFQSTPPSSPIVGSTYTVNVTSDASLAPTVVIANSSTSVCSISAGVVTFSSTGTCTINATQTGNDQYAAAAASQQITVGAIPTTTTSTIAPTTNGPASGGASPSTTIPQSKVAQTPSTSSTSTTTTTTTTVPVIGPSGVTELEAGDATAVVRGKRVKVDVKTVNGQLVVTLPNNVSLTVGAPSGSTSSASINADGVLVAQTRDEVAVKATGFEPGSTYKVMMYSTPVELGRGEVSDDGTVSDVIVVPNKAKAGDHTLVVEAVGEGAEVVAVSIGFTVLERDDNTLEAAIAILLAIGLALLSGRPLLRRRKLKSA